MPDGAPLTMDFYFGLLCLLDSVALLCLTFLLYSWIEKQLKLFCDVWLGHFIEAKIMHGSMRWHRFSKLTSLTIYVLPSYICWLLTNQQIELGLSN